MDPSVSESSVFSGFTEDQLKRYSRHIILRQVGGKGQRKLLKARVLIIGAGGLGSPAALYLAAAGVGTLGIVDFDTVDYSNLQRQILHCTASIGKLKVVSAAESIKALNPDVQVIQHCIQLNSNNAKEVIGQYDLVLDGSDNFPTRYLINDAAFFLGKPLVHGGILLFEGMATVFLPGKGCYRCLHPVPPPPGAIPSCQEAGVLGVLPGIIGSIQATEAIKLILGVGTPLVGRLIFFDALDMSFREVNFHRNPKCPLCGDSPTIKELIDYENFCGMPHSIED